MAYLAHMKQMEVNVSTQSKSWLSLGCRDREAATQDSWRKRAGDHVRGYTAAAV